MSKIKDIFNGKEISIWDDGDFVTINLGLTTIGVPKED